MIQKFGFGIQELNFLKPPKSNLNLMSQDLAEKAYQNITIGVLGSFASDLKADRFNKLRIDRYLNSAVVVERGSADKFKIVLHNHVHTATRSDIKAFIASYMSGETRRHCHSLAILKVTLENNFL